jgi:asparagine synthase (glutamine-hydrolysing)
MCGLVAIVNLEQGRPVEAEVLERAVAALAHRGPDGAGLYLSADGQVGLGHSRLAIVAVVNGEQPIANEDHSVHVVVNGEFYGFRAQREALERRGHSFRTASDAEVALHLWEEEGEACLSQLRGEFALCLYDEAQAKVFAARDRFGIKPLHYALHEGRLYIASEAKAILAAGVPAEFDYLSVFHASHMHYVLPDRTLFKNIYQVPPGHYLLCANGEIRIAKYWDLDYGSLSETGADSLSMQSLSLKQEQDLTREFASLFDEAVKLRLDAEFPVCCHLSGGLDSASVLGFAAQHVCGAIPAFTVSFDQEGYDELEIAREMAALAGAQLHVVPVSGDDILYTLDEAVCASEGLAVNGHLSAKYLLNKAIHEAGYRVSLTGEGSDEVLAGYPHLRSDIYENSGQSHLVAHLHAENKASSGIMLAHGKALSLQMVADALGYIPSFLKAKASFGHKFSALLNVDFLAGYAGRDAFGELIESFDLATQVKGRHVVNQSLYLWSKTALANYILRTLGDGVEMAHSLEGRLPFLDHKLFEFVKTLPLSMRINGKIEKYILREAARPLISETIYRRHKHPFVAPPLSAFGDKNSFSYLHDRLSSASFADLGFLNQKALLALLESLPGLSCEERAALDPVFMMALSFGALKDGYKL